MTTFIGKLKGDSKMAIRNISERPISDSGAQLLTITPLLAESWLGKNTGNRNIRPSIVAKYARDMANGQWLVSGAAITFDPSGRLLDGQHRLHAVIASDTMIQSWVIWDVDPRAFVVTDAGANRTAGDVLKFAGLEGAYAKDVAAVAAALIRYERSGSFRAGGQFHPTRSEILEYVESHPGITDSVRHMKNSAHRIPGIRVSIAAALHFLFEDVDTNDNAAFWTSLKSGADLTTNSPILQLRNRLLDNVTAKRKLNSVEEAALTIKAWNFWREGREVTLLIWRPGGATPEKFPEIK